MLGHHVTQKAGNARSDQDVTPAAAHPAVAVPSAADVGSQFTAPAGSGASTANSLRYAGGSLCGGAAYASSKATWATR